VKIGDDVAAFIGSRGSTYDCKCVCWCFQGGKNQHVEGRMEKDEEAEEEKKREVERRGKRRGGWALGSL